MPTYELKIDMGSLMSIIPYVASVVNEWTTEKRQEFRLDYSQALDEGLEVHIEKGVAVVTAGAAVYEVLNKYGLNPVC